MTPTTPVPTGFRIGLPDTSVLPGETFNWVKLAWHGLEVQVSLGVVDILAMKMFAEKATRASDERMEAPALYTPLATHRYVISLQAFANLKSEIDTIAKAMEEAGFRFSTTDDAHDNGH